MGRAETKVLFIDKAEETNKLMQKGSVAICLKATSDKVYTFRNYEEAKKTLKKDAVTLSADGEKALEMVFRGAINRPFRVYVGFSKGDESFETDIQKFEGVQFDWFCAPEFEKKATAIAEWIKKLNEERNLEVKAVVSNSKADSEYVVNFTTKKIVMKELGNKNFVEVTPSLFTSRVASALCGTPLTRAITNLELLDVASVERISNEEYDSRIDAGELLLYNDWDKVRFARGVNSLTTLTKGDIPKKEERKKILIISKMHLWKREVKALANEKYLGNKQNGINEKMGLVTAIKEYCTSLASKGIILESFNVDLDMVAQESYLTNEKNIDTTEMTEKEIRDAKTDSYVFIKADLLFTDAMEDITITVCC